MRGFLSCFLQPSTSWLKFLLDEWMSPGSERAPQNQRTSIFKLDPRNKKLFQPPTTNNLQPTRYFSIYRKQSPSQSTSHWLLEFVLSEGWCISDSHQVSSSSVSPLTNTKKHVLLSSPVTIMSFVINFYIKKLQSNPLATNVGTCKSLWNCKYIKFHGGTKTWWWCL